MNVYTEYQKNVYLVGPMRGKPCNNAAAFAEAEWMIRSKRGSCAAPSRVYNPCEIEPQMERGLAIKKALKELMAEHVRKNSFGAVDAWEYNVVVALDGWEESEGARLEVAIATACGIPVVTLSEFLEDKEA